MTKLHYGNWTYIPDNILNNNSIVYSFGCGEDISFEYILQGKYNCHVHLFDPTPRAIEHFNLCKKVYISEKNMDPNKKFGGGDINYFKRILNSDCNIQNLYFHPYGIYNKNDKIKFYYPKNNEHVSLSIDNLQKTKDSIYLDVRSMDSIIEELGHMDIDLMKLNIEGAEVESLIYMLKNTKIRPKYISVKMELMRDKPNKENKKLQDELDNLLKLEYKIIFENKKKYNYTFKLINGD